MPGQEQNRTVCTESIFRDLRDPRVEIFASRRIFEVRPICIWQAVDTFKHSLVQEGLEMTMVSFTCDLIIGQRVIVGDLLKSFQTFQI